MNGRLDGAALETILLNARSHNKWLHKPVSKEQLDAIYQLMKWGPTSANSFPIRIVFVSSAQGKERLEPLVWEGNRNKVITAPVTAIVGYDTKFYDWLPRLFPHKDVRPLFANNPPFAEATAFRNSSLQGGYFIIAARAVGLDCGPMSGFDNSKVDEEFFPDGQVKSNFICALGYGDPTGLYGRSPRPSFDEVCRFA
jgi:nitroreductase